jgi:hypothetical protein
MVRLAQVWRERISWLQSSGLTVAAGSKELGVSVASEYRWKKLLAEALCSGQQQPTRRRRTIPVTAAPQTTLPLLFESGAQNNPQHQLVHRIESRLTVVDQAAALTPALPHVRLRAARRRSSVCK